VRCAVRTFATVKHDRKEAWWCHVHKREAKFLVNGRPCCDPALGGITMPCQCELATETERVLGFSVMQWREGRK
jgi:hypothetical protein